jgi:hypothetical protein
MLGFLQRFLIYVPTRAASIRPEDASFPQGRVHTVSVRTGDNLELNGWLVLAEGQSATTAAECDRELRSGRRLVLFFCGNGGNRRHRVPEYDVLAVLGANVLIMDYRGYGENPGSPSEEKLAADALAVWKYATEQRNVPPEKIILFGESLGGGVAVRLAEEVCRDTPPGGMILRSTFSSLVDAGKHHYPWLPINWVLLDRFNSVERIPAVTCPLLLLHGSRDRIVPIEMGRRLFDAAPAQSASGVAKRFVEFEEANHNDVMHVAEVELRRAVAEFFQSLP